MAPRFPTIAEIFNEPKKQPSLAHAIGPSRLLSLAEQIGPERPLPPAPGGSVTQAPRR